MNWTDNPYPVATWDTPGLPPRTMTERCARHKHCAYRDDDPALCSLCHASHRNCNGAHGGPPYDKWSKGVAGRVHTTLKAGQYNDPREAAKASPPLTERSRRPFITASRKALASV
jgi:hypothetical protein